MNMALDLLEVGVLLDPATALATSDFEGGGLRVSLSEESPSL